MQINATITQSADNSVIWHQWLAWQQHFFLSIFSVSCYGISPKTKFVNCLRKKTPKTHAKEHIKSLNKCFMNICWKRGLQNSEIAREKRNCSSFKKVLGKRNLFFRYHVYFLRLQCIIKQLSDSVFVICGIINVSVRVICLAFGSADNSYLDVDNSAYHKNLIQ